MSEEIKEQTYIRWLRHNTGRQEVSKELYEHAWEVARRTAQLLRDRYDVVRVRAFGSLVHEERFHPGSDIDLAVEGLSPSDYWKALADVLFIDDQVLVELVDRDTCRQDIWRVVEQEGIDL